MACGCPAGRVETVTFQTRRASRASRTSRPSSSRTTTRGFVTIRLNVPSLADVHGGRRRRHLHRLRQQTPRPGRPTSRASTTSSSCTEERSTSTSGTAPNFTRRFGDPPATTLIYSWSERSEHQDQCNRARNTKKMCFFTASDRRDRLRSDHGEPCFARRRLADFARDLGRGFSTYDVKVAPARLGSRSITTTRLAEGGEDVHGADGTTRSDTGATIVNGRSTAGEGRNKERRAEVGAARRRPGRLCLHDPRRNGRQDPPRDAHDRSSRAAARRRPSASRSASAPALLVPLPCAARAAPGHTRTARCRSSPRRQAGRCAARRRLPAG